MGGSATSATSDIERTALGLLDCLRESPGSIKELMGRLPAGVKSSRGTVSRAMKWLIDEAGAPISKDGDTHHLKDPGFRLPLTAPTSEDVVALGMAAILLQRFGDEELSGRLDALLEQLDDRCGGDQSTSGPTVRALSATSSFSVVHKPHVLATLLRRVTGGVVKMEYLSPWAEPQRVKTHTVELWGIRIHDGDLYVRGWSREHQKGMTFNVASILSAGAVAGDPKGKLPPRSDVWGETDPHQGPDVNHAGTAVVILRGGTARYHRLRRWSKVDHDVDLQGGRMQRTFDYGSRRVTARRLLALGDGLEAVEPEDLRREMCRCLDALRAALTPSESGDSSLGPTVFQSSEEEE